MKVNQIVAKSVIRIFFILLFVALVPFIIADETKLQHIYLTFHNKWEMIFPAIIILSFIILLLTCLIKRYKDPQLNWLLVVNTIVLLAYGIALYIRVMHMM